MLQPTWQSIVALTRRSWRTVCGIRFPDTPAWLDLAQACGTRRFNASMANELLDLSSFAVEYLPDRTIVLSDAGDRYAVIGVQRAAVQIALHTDSGGRAGDRVRLALFDYESPDELADDIDRVLRLWRIRPRARDARGRTA